MSMPRVLTRIAPILMVLSASCVSAPDEPNGCIAYSPAVPLVATLGRVCATQLDEHWAVSVRHGTGVLDRSLGTGELIRDPDYDMVFFRRDAPAPAWRMEDVPAGESVRAAGNPGTPLDWLVGLPIPTREEAAGKIVAHVWFCGTKTTPMKCAVMLAFSAKVKPGYSGGSLVDSEGKIIGVTTAETTEPIVRPDGITIPLPAGTGIAMPAELIWAEFRRLIPASASDQ